jgi:hypothetical protein
MISLCVPTRGRPERFANMVQSARQTAAGPIEICAWLDDDDESRYPRNEGILYGSGPRPYVNGSLCTSGLWNKAWSLASGDIAQLVGDDFVYRTPGWDTRVEALFYAVPDKILMAYADDGTARKAPINPFLHRRWIEAVGFVPDGWQGWFGDEWIWVLATELERIVFLSDVRILHVQRHGSDDTYRDGEAARAAVGGWQGMRERFYQPAQVAARREQLDVLQSLKADDRVLMPDPKPVWLLEALRWRDRILS